MGDTTMRFFSVIERKVMGLNRTVCLEEWFRRGRALGEPGPMREMSYWRPRHARARHRCTVVYRPQGSELLLEGKAGVNGPCSGMNRFRERTRKAYSWGRSEEQET